jgi:Flp pilus assembly protein TadD
LNRDRIVTVVVIAATVLTGIGLWSLSPAGRAWQRTRWDDATLAAHPNDPAAVWELAGRLARQGRYGEAASLYRGRNDARGLTAATAAFLKANQPLPALAAGKEAAERAPSDAGAQRALGEAALAAGDTATALAALEKAVELAPGDADARIGLAGAALARKNYARAEEAARQATRLAPGDATAFRHLGTALRQLARADEAASALKKAIELAPGSPEAHTELGLLLAADPLNRTQAITLLTKAVTLSKQGPETLLPLLALARLQLNIGKLSEAEKSFQAALTLRPDEPSALFGLVRTMEQQGKTSEAARFRARFERQSAYELRVGQLQTRLGREPDNLSLLTELAALHRANDQPAREASVLAQSLRVRPDQPAVRRRLEELQKAL